MEFTLTPDLLTSITHLPKSQRAKVMALVGRAEWDKCANDPMYWLDYKRHCTSKRWPSGIPYVFTKDPHNIYTCDRCDIEVNEERRVDHLEIKHGEEHPTLNRLRETFTRLPDIRPFPVFEYIPPIVEAWQTCQYFAMEKSRDMSATWLMIALHTWDAMFHKGRQEILQSEDAVKTLELVQRAKIIYDNTPAFLKGAIGEAHFSKSSSKSGELFFKDMGSEILGLPQGADQIRQYHPSAVFADEAAFQAEAGSTFAAIKPAIMNGGRYSAISSANRSWFELTCRDRTDDN